MNFASMYTYHVIDYTLFMYYTNTILEPPVITAAPEDLTVNEGTTFTLTCNFTGVPIPNITWYKDDIILSPDPLKLQILTNRITVLSPVVGDEGIYNCVVENAAGITNAEATIDVIRKFDVNQNFVRNFMYIC